MVWLDINVVQKKLRLTFLMPEYLDCSLDLFFYAVFGTIRSQNTFHGSNAIYHMQIALLLWKELIIIISPNTTLSLPPFLSISSSLDDTNSGRRLAFNSRPTRRSAKWTANTTLRRLATVLSKRRRPTSRSDDRRLIQMRAFVRRSSSWLPEAWIAMRQRSLNISRSELKQFVRQEDLRVVCNKAIERQHLFWERRPSGRTEDSIHQTILQSKLDTVQLSINHYNISKP